MITEYFWKSIQQLLFFFRPTMCSTKTSIQCARPNFPKISLKTPFPKNKTPQFSDTCKHQLNKNKFLLCLHIGLMFKNLEDYIKCSREIKGRLICTTEDALMIRGGVVIYILGWGVFSLTETRELYGASPPVQEFSPFHTFIYTPPPKKKQKQTKKCYEPRKCNILGPNAFYVFKS